MNRSLQEIQDWPQRTLLLTGALAVLVLAFLFQHFNYVEFLSGVFGFGIEDWGKKAIFSANKTVRFIINDVMTIVVIYALFYERKYVIFAIFVQLFGLLVLLPSYLIAKWYYPGYNGPMINYLHRLTLNPVLLMLLIPVFMFQKKLTKRNN